MAALVKLFLLSSPPHALRVPVDGPTASCPSPCAGGFVIRGTPWPQTTFYPWLTALGQAPDPAGTLGACEARGWTTPPHNRFTL